MLVLRGRTDGRGWIEVRREGCESKGADVECREAQMGMAKLRTRASAVSSRRERRETEIFGSAGFLVEDFWSRGEDQGSPSIKSFSKRRNDVSDETNIERVMGDGRSEFSFGQKNYNNNRVPQARAGGEYTSSKTAK